MKLLKKLLSYFDTKTCHKNYQKKIKKLQVQKEKIRVLFLIRENQKWSYQSLYEEMVNSEVFEPVVAVSILTLAHIGKDKTRNNLEGNYNFFKNRSINVEYAYKDNQYIDLREFNPDIVFYDQPWDLPKIHEPKNVSKFALTCSSSYSLPMFDYKEDYTNHFHAKLYMNFTDSEFNLKRYSKYSRYAMQNCKIVGYSKLDEYLKNNEIELNKIWKNPEKTKIIYAPHHSFEDKDFRCATFDKNGKNILEFAKNHPETSWIFKPHPRFKHAVLRNKIMNKQEIETYYNQWEEIGNVYEQGDYFDIFKSSDLMITDCCSFLGEYLPADKPLFRLINKNSMKLNDLGNALSDSYYSIGNMAELETLYNRVVVSKDDYKKEVRSQLSPMIFDKNNSSAKKIINTLLKALKTQECHK